LTFAHCHIKLISILSGKLADIMKKDIWRQRISEMCDCLLPLSHLPPIPSYSIDGAKRKGL